MRVPTTAARPAAENRIELARADLKTRLVRSGVKLHTIEFGEIDRRAGNAEVTISTRTSNFKPTELTAIRRTLTNLHDAHQTTHFAPALEKLTPISVIKIRLSLLKP